MLTKGQIRFLETEESELACFLNAVNGFILTYRFQRMDSDKYGDQMSFLRVKSIDLVYDSLRHSLSKFVKEIDTQLGEDRSTAFVSLIDAKLESLIDDYKDQVKLKLEEELNDGLVTKDSDVLHFVTFFNDMWLNRWDLLVADLKITLKQITKTFSVLLEQEAKELVNQVDEYSVQTDLETATIRKAELRRDLELKFELAEKKIATLVEGISGFLVDFARDI